MSAQNAVEHVSNLKFHDLIAVSCYVVLKRIMESMELVLEIVEPQGGLLLHIEDIVHNGRVSADALLLHLCVQRDRVLHDSSLPLISTVRDELL